MCGEPATLTVTGIAASDFWLNQEGRVAAGAGRKGAVEFQPRRNPGPRLDSGRHDQ